MVAPTNDQAYLRRVEQDVFSDAAGVEMSTPRWFADYTVSSPSVVELDWRLIRKVMAPKASARAETHTVVHTFEAKAWAGWSAMAAAAR